ncbi:RHS repeat-associated core domain-containing protein [Plantactinospora sp. B24E8]|uniref:RHS repeat-associated core domain-containing protein n=1 Tax=Plantactinospora sp. B24E8 TaxID=3153567 RepID=UPI00325EF6E4
MQRQRWNGRTSVAAALTAAVMAAGLLVVPTPPASAAPAFRVPDTQLERSVPGTDFVPRGTSARTAAGVASAPAAVAWPAGTADTVLSAGSRAQAGDLPVRVGVAAPRSRGTDGVGRAADPARVPGRARVRVLDRAATERVGVAGLLLTVTPDRAGDLSLEVDYSAFRSAYGGDWAARLRLVRLPDCALTTPDETDCRTGTPLATTNSVRDARLAADVSAGTGATLLAVTAAPAGSAGDYRATKLSASSSWQAGGSAGDFTWSYPLEEPPAFGGPTPDLDLQYSSGSVDGRTASTNNQSSWVGEGWDLSEGFIERRYKSCSDDVTTTPKPYDLCWETDNAFLNTGGRTVELVRDAASGTWRLRNDDGSRVERLTGASNGDNDGEHWRITTRDGTRYHYGLHRLPGWASGNEVTNSTWTAPVFGNDSGEPCHASSFAASYCTQAWRWNLDYVVDPNGNAMSYFYETETNHYGRNRTASAGTSYVRAGHLRRIDYGQRSDTMYSASAPMRVVFGTEERCAAGATCGTGAITKDTAKNWPDVPYDQACAAGATCTDLFAPTFWSRRRLASVTTRVLASGTTYRDVDTWTLGYQFRDPGDGTSPALWLASVTNTGKVGGSLALPAVRFEGVQLENRVDAEEGIPPMYKWRLSDVYDESGGHVRVNYSAKDCTRSATPTPDSNTRRCFPQYWVPEGALAPKLDWFHKYVAVQVLEDDQSGLAGIEQTDYEYLGGAAWHYDDNELTPAKYRTWSEWRGFARVRTTRGAPGGVRSQHEELYLRGMDGDRLSSGTRSVSVTDSEGVAVTDHPALAGFVREEITYDGVGGAVVDGEIRDGWVSAATATRGSTRAYLTGVSRERSRLALAAGGWRRTETRTGFDSYGLPSQVDDLGDLSTTTDDECLRTTYARDTGAWMIEFVARQERVGVACGTTPSRPGDVISDLRTFYDGSTTFGAAPTRGDVTLTQELSGYPNGSPVYVQATRARYDSYGRTVEAYDALDRKTTTAFTPASGGPTTGTVVTDALGHTVTTTLEPAWGQETAIVDPNGRRVDQTYDPLGRATAIWFADRSKADGASPNQKYSYLVRTDAPNVVTTQTLRDDGGYESTYEFYDGQLRERQTQAPAPDGGRTVTDTYHDSRGLVSKENGAYWNEGAAGTTLLVVADNTVPAQTRYVHDGVDRETVEILVSYGTEKWRTTSSYGGDRTHVTPPAGGTATTTVFDAEGRTTELRQYTGPTPSGSYDATTYTYARDGQLASVTDAMGNVWRYGYDLRGRKIEERDPDRGTIRYSYDDADQLLTTTDARGVTLAYGYDQLGRKTALYEGSTSGPKRAEWTYDRLVSGVPVKGQLASSTRYVNGNAYVVSVNGYDTRYRSLGTTVTIPAAEGALAGSYRLDSGYTDTGLDLAVGYPAVGGLAAETLRYGYDAHGRLQSAQSGLGTQLVAASYTPYDEVSQYTLQAAAGKQLVQTFFYDDTTRQLSRALVDRSVSPTRLADVNYTYDPAGNVTRISDRPTAGTTDTQCFRYDHLRRLREAWTATDDCAAAPTPAVLGGPAPYWQSWEYDKTGNRLTETNRSTTTGAGVTSRSTYPAAGGAQPHALATVTTGDRTDRFGYDATGNTTGRTVGGSSQVLTWDAEGDLSRVTEGAKVTEFLYDADGDRLIRRDPTSVTLYLPNTEVKLTRSTGAVSAARFYDLGEVTAVRTSTSGLAFEVADRHNTAQLSVDAADLAVTQRRYLPFGELRGAGSGGWPTDRGYVGGTVDASTGLTHLGAREYDPELGRFLSVDPLIDPEQPQQMNGYAYSDNTPVTMSDPDGQWRILPGGHYCDGCGGYNNPPPKKGQKAKKKTKKKATPRKSPARSYYCDSCHYSKPKPKVYPGDLRQHDQAIAAEARRLAREYAAKQARKEREKKAREAAEKRKKSSSCKLTSFWSSACRKAAGRAVKSVGRGAAKVGKWAWKNRSTILAVCSAVAVVVCGIGAAISSGYDAYKDFKSGNYRSGALNALSGLSGGLGAGFAAGSKLAARGAKLVNKIPTPNLWTKRGYRVSSSIARGLGRSEAALRRGTVGGNFKSNMWGTASFGFGVSNTAWNMW